MKAFDPNHKLLDEMYQDDYYPAFLAVSYTHLTLPTIA